MSLYLKYRPSDFTNLVGQSFVKETLQKAIANNKTVGAYLFCGPRGTGKTSTARIFAKAVNCENQTNGNPCLKCNICKQFAADKLIDIIEIDAASHTGVDNIREIIEKAQFSPTQTKYKIYIIDEVHMLSKGAFNALLKILEEPPKHVKFILATTETHKVPETIISRCQRYDFKRISNIDIENRLNYIADSEGVKIDNKSIQYIIKNSSGGLRNAISLFEQLINDNEIKYSTIVEKLEIVDESEINNFLSKLISKDKSVITIIEKNIADGKNIKLFFKELLFFTKNKSLELLKKGEDINDYINILEILDDSFSKTKNSLDENITFLIGILKIINNTSLNVNNSTISNNNIDSNKSTASNKNIPEKKNNNIKEIEEISLIKNKNIITEDKIHSNELDKKDITDIFCDTTKKQLGDFNNAKFIDGLKINGVTSANINTLKNSKLNLNINKLNIITPNPFLKKTINKSEAIQLFIKTLSDMGIENPEINIT